MQYNSGNSVYGSSADDGDILLPIDVAIRKSIESCSTDDLKMKMYGGILLVGGGLRFKGAAKYLHQRLAMQVTLNFS